MLARTLFLLLLLAAPLVPLRVSAQSYVVQPGDTLGLIAKRYHVALSTLARFNRIVDVNLIQVGRVLAIPARVHTFYYRVRWGDTLLGLAARYRIDVHTIRTLNPRLGVYPLAGQWLKLCGPCSPGSPGAPRTPSYSSSRSSATIRYVVQPGDTLIGIALRYGITPGALMAANHIRNPNRILIGSRLAIPRAWSIPYDPWAARSLIVSYARSYGIAPALPLAIGWQESGFNQNLVSKTGAIGVMQVEPYTGRHISTLLGRSFNLYQLDDNVHAGVYWLTRLLAYYGGNERLAAAAYYQGTRAIARYGLFQDTVQYVNSVMALKSNFGG